MELAVLILSLSLFVSLIFIGIIYSKNIDLHNKVSSMESEVVKTKKEQEDLVSIDVGDRAIIPNYGLTDRETKEGFEVTYEVEILEVSTKKVKVKAIGFTSTDRFARDPKNKSSIIQFLQDKWVDRKSIELVVDDQIRRDKKIKQILE